MIWGNASRAAWFPTAAGQPIHGSEMEQQQTTINSVWYNLLTHKSNSCLLPTKTTTISATRNHHQTYRSLVDNQIDGLRSILSNCSSSSSSGSSSPRTLSRRLLPRIKKIPHQLLRCLPRLSQCLPPIPHRVLCHLEVRRKQHFLLVVCLPLDAWFTLRSRRPRSLVEPRLTVLRPLWHFCPM